MKKIVSGVSARDIVVDAPVQRVGATTFVHNKYIWYRIESGRSLDLDEEYERQEEAHGCSCARWVQPPSTKLGTTHALGCV